MKSRIKLNSRVTKPLAVSPMVLAEYETVRVLAASQLKQVTALALQHTKLKVGAVCWVSSSGVRLMATSGLDSNLLARSIPKDLTWFAPEEASSSTNSGVVQEIEAYLGITGYKTVLSIPIFAHNQEVMGSILLLGEPATSFEKSELMFLSHLVDLVMDGIDATRDARFVQPSVPDQNLERAITQAKESVIAFDLIGKISLWNVGATEMYGYSSQTMVGQNIEKILPRNTQTAFQDILRQSFTLATAPREMIRIHKSGFRVQVRSSLQVTRDENGIIDGFIEFSGIPTDATRADAIERLHDLVSLMPVVFWQTDAKGTLTFIEGDLVRQLGLNAKDLEGIMVQDFFADHPQILEFVEAGLNGESAHGIIPWHGRIYEFWLIPIFKDGIFSGANVLAVNVTEREAAQQELFRVQQDLATVINNLPLLMLRTNAAGTIDYMGGGILETWRKQGFIPSSEGQVGNLLLDDLHDSMASQEVLARALQGEVVQTSIEWKNHTFEAFIRPINLEQPNLGILAIGLDVTARVTAQFEQHRMLEDLVSTQTALAQQQALAAIVLETIEEGVVITNLHGNLEYVSSVALTMLGYDLDDVLGRKPQEFIVPDQQDLLLTDRQERIQGWRTTSRYQAIRADGSILNLEIIAYPRQDKGGQYNGTIALLRDITFRVEHQAELALVNTKLEQERDFALQVTSGISQGLVTLDKNMLVIYANSAILSIVGLENFEALIGTSPIVLVPEDEHLAVLAEWKFIFKGQSRIYRHSMKHPDGLLRQVEITVYPKLDQNKRFLSAIMIVSDITAQLELQTELNSQREFGLQITETINEGFALLNKNGAIIYTNPAFAKILGTTPVTLIGRKPIGFVPKDQRQVISEETNLILLGQTRTYRTPVQRLDNAQLQHIEVTAYPRIIEGIYTGSIMVMTDITERLELEKAALEARIAEVRESHNALIVANAISDGLAFINADSIVEYANPAWARMFGLDSGQEMVGSKSRLRVLESDFEMLNQQDLLLQAGHSCQYVVRIKHTDGHLVTVENKSFPRFENGLYAGFIVVIKDIGALQAQQRQNEIAASIAATVTQGLAVLDAAGGFEFMNPALGQMLQTPTEHLLGMDFLSVLARENHGLLEALPKTNPQSYFTRLKRADQTEIPVEIAYYPRLGTSGFDGAVLVITNLADQIARELEVMRSSSAVLEKEQQLLVQEQKTTLIAAMIEQGIAVFDATGSIEYVNPAYLRMFGFENLEALTAVAPTNLVHPEDWHIVETAANDRLNHQISSYALRMLHSDGSSIEVEVTGYPRFVGNEFFGSITVINNLSERTRRERALEESNIRYQTLFAQAQYDSKRLELIDQIRNSTTVARNSQELIQMIVQSIHTVLGHSMVSIYLLEQSELVLQHAIGYETVITHFAMTGNGVMVRSARGNQVMLIEDAHTDPDFKYPMHDVRSEVCVPITANGQVLGVINLEELRVGAFDQNDAQLLLDIADRIGHRVQLTRTLDQLRILENAVGSSNEFVLITNAEIEFPGPSIVYANPAFMQHTGYTWAELEAQSPRLLQGSATDLTVLTELKLALYNNQAFKGKTTNYKKDGTPYMVEWDISPVYNNQQQVTHFMSIQRDISERLRIEQLLDNLMTSLRPNQRLVKPNNALENITLHLSTLNAQLENDSIMRGQLESLGGVVVLLQMFSVAQSSGALYLKTSALQGTLFLESGRIVAVEHPHLTLKRAVIDLVRLKTGTFQFDNNQQASQPNLDLDPTVLVLELARREDEQLEQLRADPNRTKSTQASHVLVLPNIDAAQNFMRGVGGETHFIASLERHQGWEMEKLTFRGRLFVLVVLEGDLSQVPDGVKVASR